MSNENQSANSSNNKPKKFNLDELLPAKMSITTSIGVLYVRHPSSSDWKRFEFEDAVELGRMAVQLLCNRIEDKHDSSALQDDDLELLNAADYQVIAQAIAKQGEWRELSSGSGLKDLGELIKEEKQVMTEQHEKMLGDLRKSIESSYSFLGKGVLDKLQDQMAGIANIRSSLSGAESLQAALRKFSLQEESWRKSLSSMDTIDKAIRGVNAANKAVQVELPKAHDVTELIMPPRFEETSMGRATLESLENSRQVAKKMDDLVVVVAGLNQTLVEDVLPAWFNKIKEDQTSAKGAFDQAARGLWWTKWAMIASVFVTIVATWWQVDVARSIDRENSEQQKRAEVVLREQLAVQQKLIEQQAKDAAAMREVVKAMKEAGPMSRPQKR